MGYFEPKTVSRLGAVLDEVCRTLENGSGRTVSGDIKDMLAKRILAEYEAGVTDPSVLKADALSCVRRTENA
jgi:hypothetical protein